MSCRKTIKGILIYPATGFLFVFLASVLAGFRLGVAFGTNPVESAGKYTTPRDLSPPNQQNLLLLHADHFDKADVQLKSAWLVAYYSNSARVDLLPIYPDSNPGTGEDNSALARSFYLTAEGEPGESFWLEMQRVNTWWNAYILLDNDAIQTLIEHFGEPGAAGNIDPSDLPEGKDPQAAIGLEASYYASLCQEFAQNADLGDFIHLMITLNNHFITDLKPGEIHDIWQLLGSYDRELNCNFPSIHVANP